MPSGEISNDSIHAGDVFPVAARQISVAGEFDGEFRRLAALEIVGVEPAAVLEDDGAGAEAGPFDVVVGEMGELAHLAAANVVAIEIHALAGAAIAGEINRVAAPHGIRVGAVGVWHLLERVVDHVVDQDFLRHAAAIAFPGAEIAEDRVVGDFRAVGGIGGEAAAEQGQPLGQAAVDAHFPQPAEPRVEGIVAGKEDDRFAVRGPGDHFIVRAHALGDFADVRPPGQLFRLAAGSRHHVDIEIAVVLRREGDPFAIGRKFWKELESRRGGDAPRDAARRRREPQIAAVAEDDLIPRDVGKAEQAPFGHLLRPHGRGEEDGREQNETRDPVLQAHFDASSELLLLACARGNPALTTHPQANRKLARSRAFQDEEKRGIFASRRRFRADRPTGETVRGCALACEDRLRYAFGDFQTQVLPI